MFLTQTKRKSRHDCNFTQSQVKPINSSFKMATKSAQTKYVRFYSDSCLLYATAFITNLLNTYVLLILFVYCRRISIHNVHPNLCAWPSS